jgi:membrane-bound inhibitor of C-type lysozyme
MKRTYITILILVIIAIIGFALFKNYNSTDEYTVIQPETPSTPSQTQTTPITVSYACDNGKTIQAIYSPGVASASAADQMPTPSGTVALTFGDRSPATLSQTISADGSRYANSDESFIFWSKGNGALVLENNQSKTYIGCVSVAKDPTGTLSKVYHPVGGEFSIRYPSDYTLNSSYKYQELGEGKDITGIKLTIPASLVKGTNLSTDSYISVEEIPRSSVCSASSFVMEGSQVSTVTENGTQYSMAISSDAGAGNRYEETVYALPGTNPCIGIRYFIHYGAIENYPSGTVKQFDRQALVAQFDQIRRTLTVNQ